MKSRLTTWLIDQRRLGNECPKVTDEIVKQVSHQKPLPVHVRADRLLQWISRKTQTLGQHHNLSMSGPQGRHNVYGSMNILGAELAAVTESVGVGEIIYLLDYLKSEGLAEGQSYTHICVTPKGYAHLAELETKVVEFAQAFVAMWFDPSMDTVYDNAIYKGIDDAGYKPFNIGKQDHNNKIDDQIVAEIRRSRFVVADFTHGRKGMRGGVYYEAGFAHGLNIPVIFTCREDLFDKIHFDTRQYNHIPWEAENLADFREKLARRISATIGYGPLKPPEP